MRRLAVAATVVLALGGCPQPEPEPPADNLALTPARFADLPGWTDERPAEALPALLRSCTVLQRLPADRPLGRSGTTVADWQTPCTAARAVPAGDDSAARRYFETWFAPWRAAAGNQPDGLFTGYYEAELRAAPHATGRFTHPIYGRPSDLVTVDLKPFDIGKTETLVGRLDGGRLVPYPRRVEIDRGALGDRAPVLLWADDPVDVLLLHIQGSGRVTLPDGSLRRVGFAASNGHRFVGIGKTLIERGKLPRDQATMPAVVAWLKANPAEAATLVAENPRYIFFRLLDGEGPLGAQGVALTPGRSMAVDPDHIPFGVPLWLDTKDPDGQPLRRLMLAQDSGAAIKGPVRGDFFWGSGAAAFDKAGRMKSRGGYWLLLPKRTVASAAGPSHGKASGQTTGMP